MACGPCDSGGYVSGPPRYVSARELASEPAQAVWAAPPIGAARAGSLPSRSPLSKAGVIVRPSPAQPAAQWQLDLTGKSTQGGSSLLLVALLAYLVWE